MNKNTYPAVSVVVIGRNEANNLHKTFSAINNLDYPKDKLEIIYIDTDSTDDSVAIARRYTDKIFIEKSRMPSPALARNRGLIEAKYDIIHFIDGDIQIARQYLRHAVAKLQEDNIHGVYGYLEELSNKGINKLLLTHWKEKKEGISSAAGAGGTFIRECLLAVNGYDERIVRGEETELGERFKEAGYNIYFINKKMGTHNYDVNGAIDYLKCVYRDGKVKASNSLLGLRGKFIIQNNRTLRNLFIQNIGLFILFLIAVSVNKPTILIFSFMIYIFYILVKYFFIRKIRDKDTMIYYLLMNISKPIAFWGSLSFFWRYFFDKSLIKPKMILKK